MTELVEKSIVVPAVFSVKEVDSEETFRTFVVGFFASVVLRIISATLRWRLEGLDGEDSKWVGGPPRILAFWHGQQLLMPWILLKRKGRWLAGNPARRIYILISKHRDGRIVAQGMKSLGLDSVAGSSTRGGREAMFALIKVLQSGSHAAITPDGPKGPRCTVKEGLIRIAQRAAVPIYPTAFACKKVWTFGSWDKMILPKPFSRAVLVMGAPIGVPSILSKDDLELLRLRVEMAINEVTARAGALSLA